jgi:PAS domain S-box-containing protein
MKLTRDQLPLFNLLDVGISLLTWDPVDLDRMDWAFVNDTRCAMTGFSREEIVSKPITVRSTREARSLYEKQKAHIQEYGFYNCETKLLHKDLRAVPVLLFMKLVEMDGETHLLSELHDITVFKKTEEELMLSRESTSEMLSLIEKEKQKITENIQGNLGRVLFPLMEQMRVTGTDPQKEVLDLMTRRVGDVCREAGIPVQADRIGAGLTNRQTLICEMIRDGMTSKDIAGALGCSPSTVNNHRDAIRRKLGLSGRGMNLQTWLNDSGINR